LYHPIETLTESVDSITAGALLERVQSDLGRGAVVELNQDLLAELHCAACGETEPLHASLGKVSEKRGRCPRCGADRAPTMFHTLYGTQRWLDKTLAQLGVPPWDILAGRAGEEERYYELGGDRAKVLGPLET
jgi:adenylyltransferase/sulfurtransferase